MLPWHHIAFSADDSPWISLTADPSVMYGAGSTKVGNGANGYIAVDLSRVSTEVVRAWDNISVPSYVRDTMGIDVPGTAFRDREVLAKWRLPSEAIVRYWPPGTSIEKILKDLRRK
ncbi:hypothetical protein [Streptomyces sp. NPDC091027]|uniref:hypothetical protein n=1 Tax=Streptomyces sp. NPDC091027 TaxID=3365971 RepID=UPI003808208C